MSTSGAAPAPDGPGTPESYDWALGFKILGDLLAANDGCVSSMELRRELQTNHGIADARPLVIELKFLTRNQALNAAFQRQASSFIISDEASTQRRDTTRN